jgi:Lipopolysaccharide-assembly
MKRLGCGTFWLALLPVVAGCTAYQIGNQSLYPAHIQTVYVPIFESGSFRRNFGERLTEAIVKEIELKTPYKVVDSPDADSTLRGQILSESKHITVGSITGEARESDLPLVVKVTWLDRRGAVLRDAQSVPCDASLTVMSAAKVVPEVGQSVTTQQQAAIQKVAQRIVSLMEAPW